MRLLSTIGFDADDTLWHNERFFKMSTDRFEEMMADVCDEKNLAARLIEAEKRNIGHYGFGVKGFTLSMIETALDVSDGKIGNDVIRELLNMGRDMLSHPIELLPHVQEVVKALSDKYRLILITKGDLLHQETKLAQSGLGDYFDQVEIVSDKTHHTYARIFSENGATIDQSMMIGNSMKSDVRPAIDAGAWGVFVPHDLTWDFEHAEAPEDHPRYRQIRDLGDLPNLIADLG